MRIRGTSFLPLTYNGEVMKMTWPEVTDIKNMRYTNRRYLRPYYTLRALKSLNLRCIFDRLSNFEKMQLEVRSLNVTWRRDLWGHRVIVFWKCAKLLAEQLWQIWRRYAPPFFRYLRKTWGGGGGGRITAPGRARVKRYRGFKFQLKAGLVTSCTTAEPCAVNEFRAQTLFFRYRYGLVYRTKIAWRHKTDHNC